tara:strand:+ start:1151 stop:3547 length:2397 start_codon:yes stop_codon:yes gene_type:complete
MSGLGFSRFFIFLFLLPFSLLGQNFTVSGTVKDAANGEDMISAMVYTADGDYGTATNVYGYYALELPKGKHTLLFSYSGFETFTKEIDVQGSLKLSIDLKPQSEKIDVVIVKGKRATDNFKKIDMSTVELDMQKIEKIPALLGEADVVKAVQLMPGVSTVGEGATGFNVRGGGIDQNLILLDEAPVFNSSHLFGFFSVFNPDAVKNVKLIKGGIPSEYGGRLSSVLDVRMKEGNAKKVSGQGGYGLIFSRLSIEAPIVKNKASFILAGRRSYIDILAKPALKDDFPDAKFYFYDLTAKVHYDISDKNKVYLSGYLGRDVFAQGFGFDWGNQTATARWNHIFNDKLFLNTTAYFSNYDFKIGAGDSPSGGFEWLGQIRNYSIKPSGSYFLNNKNTIQFGGQSILYDFKPGESKFYEDGEEFIFSQDSKYGLENAVYLGNEQKINKSIILKYGLRFSSYYFLGPSKEYIYGDRLDQNSSRELLDVKDYSNFKVIKDYYNWEPRFSAKFDVDKVSSVKLSYNRMAQYIHLMSNTAASTPLDFYSPTTNNIRPQLADQIAGGYFRNYGKNLQWESSLEVYYKDLQNQIGYIPTAELQLNDYYEGDLYSGDGRAYGTELMLRKNSGKLSGWLSLTLSKTQIKVDSINNGNYYNARFDKPVAGNCVLNYKFNKRFEFNANFVYNTGAPFTASTTHYSLQGVGVSHNPANERNNARVSDYHRLDVSFIIHGKEYFTLKVKDDNGNRVKQKYKKPWSGNWIIGAYNVYARKNAFTVYFSDKGGEMKVVQYSIIGTIIPSFTYNIKF